MFGCCCAVVLIGEIKRECSDDLCVYLLADKERNIVNSNCSQEIKKRENVIFSITSLRDLVAQWLEQPTSVRKVMGSILVGTQIFSFSHVCDILIITCFLSVLIYWLSKIPSACKNEHCNYQ